MAVSFIGGGDGVPGENLWQTLSHNVASNAPRHEQGSDAGVHPARAPPLKLEKIWFFGDFSHEIPQKFRASLRSAQFFLSAPPLTWNPGSSPGMHNVSGDRHWFHR
jgi:hypothetical protein